MRNRRFGPAGLGLAAACLAPPAAQAHAILTGGSPSPGATVPTGPLPVTLTFNSRVDAGRSRVTLAHAGEAAAVVALDAEPTPGTLTGHATVRAGAYVLKWQVLAVDGHITRGVVAFTAAGGP